MSRIVQIEEFLKASPNDSFLKHALALEYIKLGDDETAKQLFQELLTHEPGYAGSYYHLGKLYERLGENEKAIEWYALVRAIELKEKDPSTVIHLVNVGAADNDPIIRKALALGGDEAIRVNADSHDSFYIAAQIAEVAKQGAYDLVFTGKETIDYNGSSIGGMVAELLDQPYVSLAIKFELNGTTAIIEREIEAGRTVSC